MNLNRLRKRSLTFGIMVLILILIAIPVMASDIAFPNNQNESGWFNMSQNVLLFHYDQNASFGENATHIYDFSGSGNNATTDATWNANGYYAGMNTYNGANQEDVIPFSQSINITDTLTVMAWINTTDTTADIVARGAGYYMGIVGGKLEALLRIGGLSKESISDLESVNDGVWHQVAMTYDKDDGAHQYARLFIDGVEASYDTADNCGGNPIDGVISSYGLHIAQPHFFGGYAGMIDELVIWNRTLTPTEISNIYLYNSTNVTNETNTTNASDPYYWNETGLSGYNISNVISMAMDTSDNIHVCTYNDSTQDLIYSYCAAGSKDCLNNDNWDKTIVFSTGNVGRYCSIDTSLNGSRVHIRHNRNELTRQGDLLYSECTGDCTQAGNWTTITLKDSSTSTHQYGAGSAGNSILVDAAGGVHIPFLFSRYLQGNYIMYAYCAGNCTNLSNWDSGNIRTSTGNDNYGSHTGIAKDAAGNIHVVDHNGYNQYDMDYFNCSAGFDCTGGVGNWDKTIVINGGSSTRAGGYNNIVIDSTGRLHIGTARTTGFFSLNYATCNTTCNSAGNWDVATIEQEANQRQYYTDILVGENDMIHIFNGNYSELLPAYQSINHFNCSAGGSLCSNASNWDRETVRQGNSTHNFLLPQAAIDSEGYFHVVYYELLSDALQYSYSVPIITIVVEWFRNIRALDSVLLYPIFEAMVNVTSTLQANASNSQLTNTTGYTDFTWFIENQTDPGNNTTYFNPYSVNLTHDSHSPRNFEINITENGTLIVYMIPLPVNCSYSMLYQNKQIRFNGDPAVCFQIWNVSYEPIGNTPGMLAIIKFLPWIIPVLIIVMLLVNIGNTGFDARLLLAILAAIVLFGLLYVFIAPMISGVTSYTDLVNVSSLSEWYDLSGASIQTGSDLVHNTTVLLSRI